MKYLFFIVLIFTFCWTQTKGQADRTIPQKRAGKKYIKVISDSTNKLTGKIENLEVEYSVVDCVCPNWIRTKDNNGNDTAKKNQDLYFYIQPAEESLELPLYFDAFRHRLKLTGQFYEREDYPQGRVGMEEPLPKAKVFRYDRLQILENPNFKPDTKIQTLTLHYNAISCPCAQWSEDTKKEYKDYYYLEPYNDKLIKADTLFDGAHLPVVVEVTGQVILTNGYPNGFNSTKGAEAGNVFRYTKIKVVQNGEKKNGY